MFYNTSVEKLDGVWQSPVDAILDNMYDDVLKQNDEVDKIEALLRAYNLDDLDDVDLEEEML